MASYLPCPSLISPTPIKKPHFSPKFPPFFTQSTQPHFNSSTKPQLHHNSPFTLSSTPSNSPPMHFLEQNLEKDEIFPVIKDSPVKFLLWVCVWASLSVAFHAFSPGEAKAKAVEAIKTSSFGVKVAEFLRGSGWPDEAVVFALATLPVIELRGAIPVGYWMQLKPVWVTVLAVVGNMVPVPFIVLYLKPLSTFLAGANKSASRFLNLLFENAKRKAGPVEEFQWLGLMLFVAVPFPGTGAWTGAFIASILDIPFWAAVSANFFGVVLAGLLVNMLVNLGLRSAVVACVVMFTASGFMWSVLRGLKRYLRSS